MTETFEQWRFRMNIALSFAVLCKRIAIIEAYIVVVNSCYDGHVWCMHASNVA